MPTKLAAFSTALLESWPYTIGAAVHCQLPRRMEHPDHCPGVLMQWWEKLLVNLTVLGVVVLIGYGAFNQVAKIHNLFTSITA